MPDLPNPSLTDEPSTEPYNEDKAREEYGDECINQLKQDQKAFQGDWWQLAFLKRCLQEDEQHRRISDDRRLGEWNRWREHQHKERLARRQHEYVHLEHARLHSARLSYADFREAHLEHSMLASAYLNNAKLEAAHLQHAILLEARLSNANLKEAHIAHAYARKAHLDNAKLTAAHGNHADLSRADLYQATLLGADLTRADFRRARLRDVNSTSAVLVGSRGLFGPEKALVSGNLDVQTERAETARFHYWPFDPWFRWEAIKRFGSLPVFGPSYAALILIVIAVGGFRWYNNAVDAAQAYVTTQPADQWVARLPELEPPPHFSRLILAVIALAMASTFYKFRCPDIVQEYSETKWNRELQKHLIEYRAADFSHVVVRHVCLVLYLAGGLYALWYIARRVWDALVYLYST